MEMLPEMEWKMKNVITRVKTTQLQNQSPMIPMEREHKNTYIEESFEVFFVPEEDIKHVN